MDKELDLYDREDFKKALKERIGRPFVFGPIAFNDLDNVDQFDSSESRQKVIDILENSITLSNMDHLCVHGYRVLIKDRTLKR